MTNILDGGVPNPHLDDTSPEEAAKVLRNNEVLNNMHRAWEAIDRAALEEFGTDANGENRAQLMFSGFIARGVRCMDVFYVAEEDRYIVYVQPARAGMSEFVPQRIEATRQQSETNPNNFELQFSAMIDIPPGEQSALLLKIDTDLPLAIQASAPVPHDHEYSSLNLVLPAKQGAGYEEMPVTFHPAWAIQTGLSDRRSLRHGPLNVGVPRD